MGDVKLPLLVMLGAVALVLHDRVRQRCQPAARQGHAARARVRDPRRRLARAAHAWCDSWWSRACCSQPLPAIGGVALAEWMIGAIVALAPAGVLRLQDAAIDRADADVRRAGDECRRRSRSASCRRCSSRARAGTRCASGTAAAPRGSFSGRWSPRKLPSRSCSSRAPASCCAVSSGCMAVDPGFFAAAIRSRCRSSPTIATARRNGPAVFFTQHDRTDDRRLPGVEAAGAASAMPFANANINIKSGLEVIGREQKAPADQRLVYVTIATPGYFRAHGDPASGRTVSRGGRRRESAAGGGDQRSACAAANGQANLRSGAASACGGKASPSRRRSSV